MQILLVVADDPDGEEREAGERHGDEELKGDHLLGVRDRYEGGSMHWKGDSDEALHGEGGHEPGGQKTAGVREMGEGQTGDQRSSHQLKPDLVVLQPIIEHEADERDVV